jgi:hypothetical protein
MKRAHQNSGKLGAHPSFIKPSKSALCKLQNLLKSPAQLPSSWYWIKTATHVQYAPVRLPPQKPQSLFLRILFQRGRSFCYSIRQVLFKVRSLQSLPPSLYLPYSPKSTLSNTVFLRSKSPTPSKTIFILAAHLPLCQLTKSSC